MGRPPGWNVGKPGAPGWQPDDSGSDTRDLDMSGVRAQQKQGQPLATSTRHNADITMMLDATRKLAGHETVDPKLQRYEGLSLRCVDYPAWADQELVSQLHDSGTRMIVVDLETTRFSPKPGAITEVAWYDVRDGVGGSFIPPHTLEGATEEALAISRYEERIAGQPTDATQMKEFHRILGGGGERAIFVAAYPTFDMGHLNQAFKDAGLKQNPWHYYPYDLLTTGYGVTGHKPGKVWNTAAYAAEFGVSTEGHHDAWRDVMIEGELLHKIEARRRMINKLLGEAS